MRLSKNQISAILTAKELCFPNAKIYLFGSRIDPSKTGGDIDLYILSEHRLLDGFKKKWSFWFCLNH